MSGSVGRSEVATGTSGASGAVRGSQNGLDAANVDSGRSAKSQLYPGLGDEIADVKRQLDDANSRLQQLQAGASDMDPESQAALDELGKVSELNRQLESQLSETGSGSTENADLKVENERLRASAARLQILESRIRNFESQQTSSASDRSELSQEDAMELRRLRAELDSQNQRNERYLLQITDLQATLRERQRSNAQSQKTKEPAPSKTGGARKPLFKRPDTSDDLKKVKGIGPVMEKTLNDLGVTTFKQLADFTSEDVQRVSDALEVFPGRIERDNWVPQAAELYRLKYLTEK